MSGWRFVCRVIGHGSTVPLSPNTRYCRRCGYIQVRGFMGRIELAALSSPHPSQEEK